jgi:UDP-N-acetylmuramyl pentapeptide synthase
VDLKISALLKNSYMPFLPRIRKSPVFTTIRGEFPRWIFLPCGSAVDVPVLEAPRRVLQRYSRKRNTAAGVAGIVVDNARRAMALATSEFFGDPTAAMATVGVTGTNGKTTVTYLLESVLRVAGRHPAVLGTVNYRFGGAQCLRLLPESVDLWPTVAGFRAQGG